MTGKVNVWIMTVDGMWHAYDDNSIYMLMHFYVVTRRNASIDFYCYA